MNRTIPQPGWLALQLMPGGSPMALCLLGMAITLNNGQASDDEISEAYLALADDSDPVWTMNEYYVDLEATKPWLIGHLDVITSWMQNGTQDHASQVARFSRLLSTVSFVGAENAADGDLLGPVMAHFATAGHRRSGVIDYLSVSSAMIDLVTSGRLGMFLETDSTEFVDTWCGPGTRAVALAQLMRLGGGDTDAVTWHLNDPNPFTVAACGLNMAANQIGPKVNLHNRKEFARLWLASRGQGVGYLLPDEERRRVLSD